MHSLLRRGGAFVAALACLSPGTASAFCRTTTEALPANYNPSRGCYDSGLFLYWRNACVSYSINAAGSRNVSYDEAKRVIDGAFATWMAAQCADTGAPPGITVSSAGAAECTEVRYNVDSGNQNLVVFRDDTWPYSDPNSTLGLTTVTFNAETGEIYDADMELNASGKNLSVSDEVPPNGFDLASVVTHEAGHFFGLAHATSTTSTMYASYKPGSAALRTLSPDDVAGLCAIYPDSATRIVSPTATGQTETLAAEACNPDPRRGLLSVCYEPPPEESGGCNAAGGSTPGALAGLVVLAGLRRGRARASARSPRTSRRATTSPS